MLICNEEVGVTTQVPVTHWESYRKELAPYFVVTAATNFMHLFRVDPADRCIVLGITTEVSSKRTEP